MNASELGYCFVLLRPETVERKFIGQMISAIESANCSILFMELQQPTKTKIARLYARPELNAWFDEIIRNHLKGKIVAIFLQGGVTLCHEIGLIVDDLRSRYGIDKKLNAIHSSDSSLEALKEGQIFFPQIKRLK